MVKSIKARLFVPICFYRYRFQDSKILFMTIRFTLEDALIYHESCIQFPNKDDHMKQTALLTISLISIRQSKHEQTRSANEKVEGQKAMQPFLRIISPRSDQFLVPTLIVGYPITSPSASACSRSSASSRPSVTSACPTAF